MKNVHAITVTYVGATNLRGSRVKLHSNRFNTSKFINYDYALNSIYDMAQVWLESKGYTCLSLSESKNSYTINVEQFIDIKNV